MSEAQGPVVFLAKDELTQRYHQAVEDARKLFPNGDKRPSVMAQFYQSMRELIEQLSGGVSIWNLDFDSDIPMLKQWFDDRETLSSRRDSGSFDTLVLGNIWAETIALLEDE